MHRRGILRALLGLIAVAVLASPGPVRALERGADGEFEKRTSSHFVLYQDVDIDRTSGFRGSRRFENSILEVLESSYRRLDELLGMRPDRPITVVIYDPDVFDARFAGLFRFPAAGFYGDSIHIRGDTQVTTKLVAVLHHELVHAAFGQAAPSLVVPAWLNEGIAEWFEARALGKRQLSRHERASLGARSQGGSLYALSELSTPSLGHLPPGAASAAYLQSYAFIDFLSVVTENGACATSSSPTCGPGLSTAPSGGPTAPTYRASKSGFGKIYETGGFSRGRLSAGRRGGAGRRVDFGNVSRGWREPNSEVRRHGPGGGRVGGRGFGSSDRIRGDGWRRAAHRSVERKSAGEGNHPPGIPLHPGLDARQLERRG